MSEQVEPRERPLSPHLQVYRLPYNALMSISGRIVGIGLSVSLLVLLGWFIASIWNPTFYLQSAEFLSASWVKYVFLLWAFATFFYMGNGVRHVLWSMGIGVNEQAGIKTGNIVLVMSLLLTIILWKVLCACCGQEYDAAPMTAEVQATQEAAEAQE